MDQTLVLQKFIYVVILGIGIQWIAWRLSIPAIILLSVGGILTGPVLGWIDPVRDFGELVQVLIKLAVAIILFEGGLNLKLHELKTSGKTVKRLIGMGLPLSWILGTLAAYYIAGLSFPTAVLLSSIVVVTGPTVIMPLIRNTVVPARITSLFKWEGILNDPLGVLLAVLVFEYFAFWQSQASLGGIIFVLARGVGVSVALGLGAGYLLKKAFEKHMVPEFLKLPIVLCMVLLVYGCANMALDEIGLLAVTIFGITMGNIGLVIIHELRQFKEHISILLLSTVFIILTASLNPGQLATLDWRCWLFLLAMLFVVRPLAIWIATLGTDLGWKERLLVGWIAPRGVVAASVAGLFGPRMIELGYEDGLILTPMVFSLIFATVILHGFSFSWLAVKLGLAKKSKDGIMIVGASSWSIELARKLREMGLNVLMVDSTWHKLKQARLQSIPIHFGEILSDTSEQNLDLIEMGYLLAATENDAYNALVCNTFIHRFGRDRIYQLPLHKKSEEGDKELRSSSRGHTAFGDEWLYETLLVDHHRGMRFQKTRLTGEFTFGDFKAKHANASAPLMIVTQKGKIWFNPAEVREEPQPGDTIISLSEPEENGGGNNRSAG
ncbi:MAG: sodium:proton exchanger [Nitrospinae bacterium CG11_big_fil_rev_8_21_14_0_20_56_8]|nr:MAG: sodium:proton exchanger [Nitrospinae bacterium CG11_big_fil_rev_8_21_14_0_20_56_8]